MAKIVRETLDVIHVKTEYGEEPGLGLKKMGAKWDKDKRVWVLSRSKKIEVEGAIKNSRFVAPEKKWYGRKKLGVCWECGCKGYVDNDGYCGC